MNRFAFAKAPADKTPETHAPDRYSLWLLTIGPTIWAVHLLLSCITAAVWCAKVVSAGGPLDGVQTAVFVYTTVASIGIGVVGWEGLRRHRYGTEATTHDLDTREDRHRFRWIRHPAALRAQCRGGGLCGSCRQYFDTCR